MTDFAAISDGDKIANPRHLERKARRRARDVNVREIQAANGDG